MIEEAITMGDTLIQVECKDFLLSISSYITSILGNPYTKMVFEQRNIKLMEMVTILR